MKKTQLLILGNSSFLRRRVLPAINKFRDIEYTIHYEFILHHRDVTVHDGIRTAKHSLKNCINCHIQKDKNGVYPRADSAEHFCAACHLFTSVEIDCFSCHADRPEEAYTSKEHTNPSN